MKKNKFHQEFLSKARSNWKDQHRVAGLSPTTLTRNSSVALGFSVSLSFPLSGNLLTPFIKIFHELRSRKWTRNLMKILPHGSQDIYGTKGGGRSRYFGERSSDPVTSPLMSSFTPDQAPSLPEVPTPVMPDSVVVNISAPSSSVGNRNT
ncbi:uncharacterized protein [Solanum tuberosum]|uniref:uncharacterized protein isoform X4 n=1 Tax=Solanum tuberosum TaxID=4113 RepID=UPI00073A3A25|nr:PREDICTED: uncharacterized protein LOC102598715 isoform X4 [Solanum tuberosum]